MLCLVNSNRMAPPIAPIGLEYVASATRAAGIPTKVVDLCPEEDPARALEAYFDRHDVDVVGVTFRNVDDCFWPGGEWFVPELVDCVATIRRLTDAPVVLGGVGYSMAADRLLVETGADYGIHGDGEVAMVALYRALRGARDFENVPGLLWREGGETRRNPPSWGLPVSVQSWRTDVDNAWYLLRGGQVGIETKRGCGRPCIYCADPVAKGRAARLRSPEQVADELEALVDQGVDVFHICDSELNLPIAHAREVCEEIVRRKLGEKIRWYAYLAITPFDGAFAKLLRRSGCVGLNFGADSASEAVLAAYRQPHRSRDIGEAVRLTKAQGITVMLDLLLGGPAETPGTVVETVELLRGIEPDCVGAALGLRLYPDTEVVRRLEANGPLDRQPGIRRDYEGPVDLFRPTFFVSPALGERPADLVRAAIGDDPRFFAPRPDPEEGATGVADSTHNYSDNQRLIEAIHAGARGAYWDILRQLRA